MRRTARALSATALAGAALGAAASTASADPVAEVSPGSVEPGGTITISVTCDGIAGSPPDFIDATSEGFEQGKVQLRRVAGNGQGAAAYRGTARIPQGGNVADGPDTVGAELEWGVDGECPGASGGQEKKWKASYTVAGDSTAASGTAQSLPAADTVDQLLDSDAAQSLPDSDVLAAPSDSDTVETPSDSDTVEAPSDSGTVEAPSDSGTGQSLPEGDTVERSPDEDTGQGLPDSGTVELQSDSGTGQRPPTIEGGVHAGEGGAFTDSVPALVVGGVLIAGGLGAAVHRLRHKDRSPHD